MNAPTARKPISGPVNIEIEQALLGALLLNNDALANVAFLRPDHFGEPIHGVIFDHIRELAKSGRATVATVRSFMPEQRVGEFSTSEYLAHLAAEAVSIVGAAGYGQAIAHDAARRRLVDIGEGIAASARVRSIDYAPAELIADAEESLFNLATDIRSMERSPREQAGDVVKAISERMTQGRKLAGVTSGFKAIDDVLGGFVPGTLSIVAGRPSMGKSAVSLSMARRVANLGHGVAFDSIEMSSEQVTIRLLSDETEAMGQPIPYFTMGRGDIKPHQLDVVERAAQRIQGLPLIVNSTGNRLSDIPGHIRSARRALEKQGHSLDLFIIDYLGLLKPSDRYAGNKVHETGEISAALKEMAKRERLPIVALHQLNRALERQDEKRPTLADLRDSGNVEQDADMVAFIYREHYYLSRPGGRVPRADDGDTRSMEARRLDALADSEHQLEFIVGKNRQGPIKTAHLWCSMATNSVRDAA